MEDGSFDEEDFYMGLLPEETKHGCGEINILKGDEYICFYHIERGDKYISSESLDFIKNN